MERSLSYAHILNIEEDNFLDYVVSHLVTFSPL